MRFSVSAIFLANRLQQLETTKEDTWIKGERLGVNKMKQWVYVIVRHYDLVLFLMTLVIIKARSSRNSKIQLSIM